MVLIALTEPVGLGGFEDEIIEKGVLGGLLVGFEPAREQDEPIFFAFVREDEGGGARRECGRFAKKCNDPPWMWVP